MNLFPKYEPKNQSTNNGDCNTSNETPETVNPSDSIDSSNSSNLCSVLRLKFNQEITPSNYDFVTNEHTPGGSSFNQSLTIEVFMDLQKFYVTCDSPFKILGDVPSIIKAFNESFEFVKLAGADGKALSTDELMGREVKQ